MFLTITFLLAMFWDSGKYSHCSEEFIS